MLLDGRLTRRTWRWKTRNGMVDSLWRLGIRVFPHHLNWIDLPRASVDLLLPFVWRHWFLSVKPHFPERADNFLHADLRILTTWGVMLDPLEYLCCFLGRNYSRFRVIFDFTFLNHWGALMHPDRWSILSDLARVVAGADHIIQIWIGLVNGSVFLLKVFDLEFTVGPDAHVSGEISTFDGGARVKRLGRHLMDWGWNVQVVYLVCSLADGANWFLFLVHGDTDLFIIVALLHLLLYTHLIFSFNFLSDDLSNPFRLLFDVNLLRTWWPLKSITYFIIDPLLNGVFIFIFHSVSFRPIFIQMVLKSNFNLLCKHENWLLGQEAGKRSFSDQLIKNTALRLFCVKDFTLVV